MRYVYSDIPFYPAPQTFEQRLEVAAGLAQVRFGIKVENLQLGTLGRMNQYLRQVSARLGTPLILVSEFGIIEQESTLKALKRWYGKS